MDYGKLQLKMTYFQDERVIVIIKVSEASNRESVIDGPLVGAVVVGNSL